MNVNNILYKYKMLILYFTQANIYLNFILRGLLSAERICYICSIICTNIFFSSTFSLFVTLCLIIFNISFYRS